MCTATSLSVNASATNYEYPETKKINIVDDYFGTKIADPYRWLENDTSAETTAGVEAQRTTTSDYRNCLGARES